MEEDEAIPVAQNRFKYKSYQNELKDVHLPSVLDNQSKLDQELDENQSHFYEALLHWQQLNLSPSYIKFVQKAGPISASLPLLLHNWKEVVDLWFEALGSSDDEGLKALLDLIQKIAQDLRSTIAPVYPKLLERLLKLPTRTIEPEALKTFLSTLSSLFKYLVTPSTTPELLETTWSALRHTLPKCLPEIQRAIAEVWGSVLRKLKANLREKAVVLIAEDLDGIDDAAAWSFVYACKSVSQTLHTVTPSLINPLITHYLTCEQNADSEYTLLRRVFTAFIHHVKGAEQFTLITDIIIKHLSSTTSEDTEKFRRVLEIAAVIASVRSGSRLTSQNITQLYALLPVTAPAEIQPALLKFSSALLTTGDMASWMSSARNYLARLWETEAMVGFTLRLHGVLVELGWGGWKMIAQPVLVKKSSKLLDSERDGREVVRLLAALCREGKMGEVDLVWKRKVEEWSFKKLKSFSERPGKLVVDEASELDDILALSTYFTPKITSVLVDIVSSSLEVELAFQQLDDFPSCAWVIGVCMKAIASRPAAQWSQSVDMSAWTRSSIRNWAWSKNVMSGVVDLSNASRQQVGDIAFDEAYSCIKDSILSHSRLLRLSSLKLLTSPLFKIPDDTREALQRCLQGEEISIDVQGVRERVLRIGKVEQMLKDGDAIGADLCVRWLTAQLKVNLRPLWSPAAKALESTSRRFGDTVWVLLFEELKKVVEGSDAISKGPSVDWDMEELAGGGADDDPWEDERSWRDPSAHKLWLAVIQWNDNRPRLARGSKDTPNDERYDHRSYELQLLSTLGECSALAEKRNRDLVPFFLSLTADSNSKLPRTKMVAWLSLFAKFQNPKALYSTETLRSLYISLLSHPDRSLQSSALSCLLTYKQRSLSLYEDKCRMLLDDTRWRDELTMLDISAIEETDRPEVVHVLVRLLFGIMLEKKGRSRGADKRSAVLTALAGCTEEELGLLVELMLKPVNGENQAIGKGEGEFVVRPISEEASDKQVNGYLTLLGDVLKNLGSRLVAYWPSLLGTTINCIASAQNRIEATMEVDAEQDNEDEAEEGAEQPEGAVSSTKSARAIRQLGLKRVAEFFRCPVDFDFAPYTKAAFPAFIAPRIATLDRENTQAPSALLELFFVWATDMKNVFFLVDFDVRVVPKILDCLIASNVKPAVISKIFDIVDRLLAHASEDEAVMQRILKPNMSLLLSNISIQIERSKGTSFISTPLGQRQIGTLAILAQYSSSASEASTLLTLFTPWLKRPSKVVPEKVKVDLLNIIGHLMQLIPELRDRESEASSKLYQLLSFLFQSLRSRNARLSLVATFNELAKIQVSLQELAEVLEGLNAYSTKRLDEPDFGRRLEAFNKLSDTLHKSLSASEWLPVLYNMLFFIHDPAELAIRTNASSCMRQFIDIVATGTAPEYEEEFSRVLFPGLKNGLHSKNELVRAEILSVISHAVHKCERISSLQDMRCLLAGGDEEANFFNNILHVQLHRRSRALRRLADQCDENPMRNSTLSDIFLPLIANYIVPTSTMDHHLVNDAINTTGRLAKHLSWSSYHALIQKYLRLSKAKDEAERVYVRTLVAVLENFHFVMEEVVEEGEGDEPREDEDGLGMPEEPVQKGAQSMAKIADAVNNKLIPSLLQYLESRDATTEDTTRIPIAIGVVKVAKHLPQASAKLQITRLLTTTSQIMRSKSQDTRDLTRDTLCRIAVVLGPSYLPTIFQELRGALLRGPHLHILATTVHHILVHVTTGGNEAQFSALDNCVADVAHVSAEVIFGESGKDVLAEGFKTKLREVKSSGSKGLDSFAITARHINLGSVSALLLPLRSIMQETETTKIMQLVDDVLKSVANGLNSNSLIKPADLLSLCHTLITQNSRFVQATAPRPQKKAKNHVIVQTKRQEAVDTDHYANNSFRFVVFGLDLLHTALRRSRFDFREPDIISRLQSMVVAVGNTLYSTNSSVLASGLKVVGGLVKCPLDSLERSLPVFIRQILEIIKRLGNTESDVAQTALKTLAVVLRDGPAVNVKEKDLTFLLELISPDLEEPSRQGSVFQMLRAIISRKFVVPEIYDLMDRVSEIMVTNQSPQVQELCRSVLLQFLLDYPQGKGRLRKQMTFLAKNLSYVHESGRKSVLELLSAIITKFQVNLIREYADILFVSLVMVVANDDASKCREMAAHLIKLLVERFDDERRQTMMSHLHVWSTQEAQSQLVRVASQVYGIVIDALGKDVSVYTPPIVENVTRSLSGSAEKLASMESHDEDSMDIDLEWQTPYYSLLVLGKLGGLFPELITPSEDSAVDWKIVTGLLLFPHAWVRTAACRLLGSLYSLSPVGSPSADSESSPLSYDGMKVAARHLALQLKSEHLDDALGLQVVKNLFFIGKCFAAIPIASAEDAEDAEDENADADEEEPPGHPNGSPLPWLFSTLSYQIRSAVIARRNRPSQKGNWAVQPMSVLRWFAAMASYLEPSVLERFLVHTLSPVYRITEDDTIQDPKMSELKDVSVELRDLIQSKVWATKFTTVYNQIRQGVLSVRKERKEAKILQMAINPQGAATRKAHRNTVKKDSRKRKNQSFR
ncbi:U3 snoRNP protein [Marasmius crinis-equi]|uniref:U3 snoRNP protein n=1 Tax=Marasmius crinis-equi TaxID=585013 RepID=A0ABR3FF05_9AGAR